VRLFDESEPFLNGTDGALRAPNEHSGGQKGRRLGEGFLPPSLFAAAEFRANEVGARLFLFLFINFSSY
jgi:hypothetical protein